MKSRSRSPLLASWLILLGFLFPLVAGATPWVERHGITAAAFQTEFNTWTAPPFNYRLTRVRAVEFGGQAQYTAMFEQSSKTTPWTARSGLSAADFVAFHNQVYAQGYRLVWLDVFSTGSAAAYNGIWEVNGGGSQRISIAESLSIFQATDATNQAAHYSLSDVAAFSVGGVPYYAGIWNSGASTDTAIEYALTSDGYQDAGGNMESNGYRLWRISGLDIGGTANFCAVWKKSISQFMRGVHGYSALAFEAENINYQYEGCRPFAIEPFVVNGGLFYDASWFQNEGMDFDHLDKISASMYGYRTACSLPGLSLAIAHNGHIVYAQGSGYANKSTGEIAHPLHRWRIASTSKTICAVSALRALEDSAAWSLDSKCFGTGALFGTDYGNTSTHPYNANEKAITIRQVMTMTAGWNNEGDTWYDAAPSLGTNHTAIISHQLDSVDPAWAPNTKYFYNNFNYELAARIPEKITGMSFLAYTQQQVFGPCGMTSMSLGGRTAADRLPNEVAYYAGNVYGDPEGVWPARMDGNAGWVCRPMDLLLLARRIDGNPRQKDIIGDYALSQMRLPNGVPDSNTAVPSSYGLAWYPSTRNGVTWWQHNGSTSGTQAILCVSDDGSQSFAYAANSATQADEFSAQLRDRVIDLMKGIDTDGAWPDIDLSGTYNTAYDSWAAAAFGSEVVSTVGVAGPWGPAADPDGDGRSNAEEAYLGSNPAVADTQPWLGSQLTSTSLVLRWTKKNGDRGVEVTPEWSSDLVNWSTTGLPAITTVTGVITPVGSTVQQASMPRTSASRYLRLRFEAP